MRKQLAGLSQRTNADISPVYTSRKIKDEIKVREDKPPLANNAWCIHFSSDTCQHLHQWIEEHKGSAIGNHLREQHDIEPEDIAQSFRILRKCQNEFDCLTFEMFFLNQRTETNAKQTVRFSSCKTICLQQILLRLFYFSIVVHFNTFLHIVSHFSGRHIFIYTSNMF